MRGPTTQVGIENIDRRQGFVNVKCHGESRVDPRRLMSLVSANQGAKFSRPPCEPAEATLARLQA